MIKTQTSTPLKALRPLRQPRIFVFIRGLKTNLFQLLYHVDIGSHGTKEAVTVQLGK